MVEFVAHVLDDLLGGGVACPVEGQRLGHGPADALGALAVHRDKQSAHRLGLLCRICLHLLLRHGHELLCQFASLHMVASIGVQVDILSVGVLIIGRASRRPVHGVEFLFDLLLVGRVRMCLAIGLIARPRVLLLHVGPIVLDALQRGEQLRAS